MSQQFAGKTALVPGRIRYRASDGPGARGRGRAGNELGALDRMIAVNVRGAFLRPAGRVRPARPGA